MDSTQLQRRGRERLRSLYAQVEIPHPFDLAVFLDRFSRYQGRPIDLVVSPGSDTGVHGLWMALSDRDVIWHPPTTALHATHIILHEVGHILCEHVGIRLLDEDVVGRLFPDINPELLGRLRGRSSYDTAEEREAELIATLILHRADAPDMGDTGGGPPGDVTVQRVRSSLRRRRGDANR